MADLYVLVHAPVLGPASWQPVGAELSKAGHRVVVASLSGFATGGPPYAPRLIRLFAAQLDVAAADRVVLVVHSGAGPLAAHLAAAVPAERVAVVFADAGLPGESGAVPVVNAGFLPYLREIATDGMVPPWPEWWPGADPAELFPNGAARAAVLADAGPLPLAFFEESLPSVPDGRPLRDAGYLLFSAGYQDDAEEARQRGWPVTELTGSHLHMLVSPAEVAAAIASLTTEAARAESALAGDVGRGEPRPGDGTGDDRVDGERQQAMPDAGPGDRGTEQPVERQP